MKFVSFSTGCILLILLPALSHAAKNDHLAVGLVSVSKPLDEKHTLFAAAGTVVENFKGELATFGVNGKVDDNLSWRLGYFLYSARIDNEERHYDHRLRGSLAYQKSVGDWQFMHRSRVEYRVGDVMDGFRYRPSINLSHGFTISDIKLKSYVEFEPFYDFRKHSNTLALYTAGIALPVSKTMSLDVSYFRVHNRESDTHTFGPQLVLNIRL